MAALASAAELNTYLQYTVDPALADLALAGASGAVRGYCGWDLLRTTETFTVEGDGSRLLTLPTLRLNDITGLLVDGVAADWEELAWFPRGQLYNPSGWAAGSKIEITVDHGFNAVPDVIRLVTLAQAARIVNNPDNVKTASVGTVTRTYDAALDQLQMRLLDPFRLE